MRLSFSAVLAGALLPTILTVFSTPAFSQRTSNAAPAPYEIQFPRDLFDHPAYEGEWWYFTGNLTSFSGKPYGFELTFFRSLVPTGAPVGLPQVIQVINADLNVSDLDGKRFSFHKIVEPQIAPLASITENPWTIQAGSWALQEPSRIDYPYYFLVANQDDFGVDLALAPEGPPILNGDNGDGLFVLDASAGQGNQDYEYYSFPRMFTLGLIKIGGETIPVYGLSWNDHEFFNLPAGESFPSWDWFSIQLDDGASMMLYGLRLPDGSYDPASRGTFIDKDGRVTHLLPNSFTLSPGTATWHSTVSGATYPVEWQISIPSLSIELHMNTPLVDQEMPRLQVGETPTYWEGAARFSGTREGKAVLGKGYLEMLGYAPQ